MRDIFVGRQPIYGRDLELYAYELLYRGGDVEYADFESGDRATSRVLLNTFAEMGLDRIVGRHLAFLNLTRGFIVGDLPLPVPREQVVLEVLEDVPADAQVLEGLRELRRKGFQIALDDFVLTEHNEPMLPFTDIVKVDVLGLDEQEIRARVELLAPYHKQLLAEKIETREQFKICLDAGFEYFQGFFLAKPNVIQGATIPASKLNLLRLLAVLQQADCDFDRIQKIVSQDVTLSYKFLRHINAAIYGMPRRIESIYETVVYLGVDEVKNLASLFMLANMEDAPQELLVTSMMRAKMCQGLAESMAVEDTQPFFTVGLFSTLDVLMDAPMETILERLPLRQDIHLALLGGAGLLGEVLAASIAYERGEWDRVRCRSLSRRELKRAFLDAVQWVDQVDREMTSKAA